MGTKIIIEKYSTEWPLAFQNLKLCFEQVLGELVTAIHHIGSTSVDVLASRPIIDIDLEIKSSEVLPQLIEVMKKIGYKHVGDSGIEGREVFLQLSESSPVDGTNRRWPMHHLYACTKDNIAFQNHIKFRDYLRANPVKAKMYGELKMLLASTNESDRDLYVERKTDFIINSLRETGFDEKALEQIIVQNKV